MPEVIEVFARPILDPRAQVAVLALLVLSLLDVLFGVLNAWFFQHDFSSHEFRQGLIRKLTNFGVVIAAAVVDAMLLGGLDLSMQPVLIAITVSLVLMELTSLMEIFAEMHPEISGSDWYMMLVRSKEGLHKTDE